MDVTLKTFFVCKTLLAPAELVLALPEGSAPVQAPYPSFPAWARPAQPPLLGTDPFLLSALLSAYQVLDTQQSSAGATQPKALNSHQGCGGRGRGVNAWEMLTGQWEGHGSVLRPETQRIDTSCLGPRGLALRA